MEGGYGSKSFYFVMEEISANLDMDVNDTRERKTKQNQTKMMGRSGRPGGTGSG